MHETPRLTDEQSKLVADNMGLAYLAALRRCKGREWLYEDCYDGAIDGLMFAARAFQPWRGFKFSTLAWKAINHVITTKLRKVPRQARGGADYDPTDEDREPHESLVWEDAEFDDEPDFEGLIEGSGLDARLREILRLRYVEGLTLREVGERFGVTREWIRQLQERAEAKVRESLAG